MRPSNSTGFCLHLLCRCSFRMLNFCFFVQRQELKVEILYSSVKVEVSTSRSSSANSKSQETCRGLTIARRTAWQIEASCSLFYRFDVLFYSKHLERSILLAMELANIQEMLDSLDLGGKTLAFLYFLNAPRGLPCGSF